MSILELFFTSLSLAMDAFAVSICKGLANKKTSFKNGIIVSTYFGIFQAIMPLLGYYLGNILSDSIVKYDHYIALILLTLIGISMIRESNENNDVSYEIKPQEMILLSIATSVDALIIGITLSFLRVSIIKSVSLIGLITLLTCFIGYQIGSIVGKNFNKYSKILGGITLIIIGIKTFIEHVT